MIDEPFVALPIMPTIRMLTAIIAATVIFRLRQ
jgi:hypothetical protein